MPGTPHFRHPAEWTPLGFSFAATCLLVPMMFGARHSLWRVIERVVAVGAIALGVLGVLFHLQSAFSQEQTLHSLVYSAPFVAPLAYVGVGLLLLLVRSDAADSRELGSWLTLLALAGFVLVVAAAVGLLGSVLHLIADLRQPAVLLRDRLRFGAPAFAPLLFTDLAALARLALWQLSREQGQPRVEQADV